MKKHPVEKLIDIREGVYPNYYDKCNAQDYQEYFIKGTNMKLGFKYFDGDTNEWNYYCIVCDGYDQMDSFETEDGLFGHFYWMLTNQDLIWRYYE